MVSKSWQRMAIWSGSYCMTAQISAPIVMEEPPRIALDFSWRYFEPPPKFGAANTSVFVSHSAAFSTAWGTVIRDRSIAISRNSSMI